MGSLGYIGLRVYRVGFRVLGFRVYRASIRLLLRYIDLLEGSYNGNDPPENVLD